MNTLKSIILAAITLTTTGLFAQNAPTEADLKTQAQNPAISQFLSGPDGAMLKTNPDGQFTVFGQGTGTYDFNDPDDKLAAQKIAMQQAKANIVKYMKEKLSTPEKLSSEMTKAKTLSKNSADQKQSSAVSTEFVTKLSQYIEGHAEELLQGVVTLQSKDVQREDGSGTFTVLICTSPKTRMVAQKLHDDIQTNVNGTQQPVAKEDAAEAKPAAKPASKTKVTIQESMTEF